MVHFVFAPLTIEISLTTHSKMRSEAECQTISFYLTKIYYNTLNRRWKTRRIILTKDVIAIVKVDDEELIDAIPLAEIKSVMEMNAVEQNGEGSDPNTRIKSQSNCF